MKPTLLIICAITYLGGLSASGQYLDPLTNLAWKKVSDSEGWSYGDVLDELDPGGAFEGYRFATTEEVWTAVENLGYDAGATSGENFDVVWTKLIPIFGHTAMRTAGTHNYATIGFTSDGAVNFVAQLDIYEYFDEPFYRGWVKENTGIASLRGAGLREVGNFLVADFNIYPVPEPATVASVLAPFGLGLIIFIRRKRFVEC